MVARRRHSTAVVRNAAAAVVATFAMLATLSTVTVSATPPSCALTPQAGATLAEAPATVQIIFSEQPDPRLSAIHVLDLAGRIEDAGPTTSEPGGPNELQVEVRPLPKGVYTVTWRTVSATDGHLATGAFAFGVGDPPSGAPARADLVAPPPSAGAIAARALLYIGVVALFGIAVIAVAGVPERPRSVVRLLPIAALLLSVGVLGVAEAQRYDAGVSLGEIWAAPSRVGSSIAPRPPRWPCWPSSPRCGRAPRRGCASAWSWSPRRLPR